MTIKPNPKGGWNVFDENGRHLGHFADEDSAKKFAGIEEKKQ